MKNKTGVKLFSLFSGISLSVSLIALTNFQGSVSLAQDPFRIVDSRSIGSKTESAFAALFEEGDYFKAKTYLLEAEKTEPNEPLVYALLASLSYTEDNWDGVKIYGAKTLNIANQLKAKDALRGNLYLAVGHFLEGSYLYQKEGTISALNKLQLVFQHFDAAQEADPNDPELNLIKGYMDLFLSVNLPFSNAEDAIKRLERYAQPNYLVTRGVAVAYRDLKQYDRALDFANQALNSTPNNPELYYLKGQILRKIGSDRKDLGSLQQALQYFERALDKSIQLPKSILKPIERDKKKTEEKIRELSQK
jgi:tetratricopeptide (TPR) repeat protein